MSMIKEAGWNTRRIIFVLMMIFLLGVFLRFFQLGVKSLWTDELVVMSHAIKLVDIHAFLDHTREDDLPKFYSLVFKYWMKLGETEFTMRSLSALCGCLSILVIYGISRLFFDIKTSLSAAFLTAVSPFLMLYDRELRMYSMFALFSLLSTYLFLRSLRDNRPFLWGLYAVVNILNIYTHYYAFLVLGVQWLSVMLRFRTMKPMIKPWIVVNGIILLSFAVKLPAFVRDVAYHAPWILPRERFPFIFGKHVVEFFYIFFSFSVGQTILPWNPLAVIICLAVFLCLLFAVKTKISFSQDLVFLVLLIFVPVLIGNVFRISMPRYFIFSAPIFFMLIARGLWSLPKKVMVVTALIVVTGWGYGLANYYTNKQFHIMAHVDPWREVGQYLQENVSADEVIVGVGIGVVPLRHYYGAHIPGYSGKDLISAVTELTKTGTEKIWLVYTYQEEYDNWLKSREIVSKNYQVVKEKKWVHDPDYALKKKLFKRSFSPYRIVAELYESKKGS